MSKTVINPAGLRGNAISPAGLRVADADGGELALVDVREGGVFAQSHLLTASNIALSVLELRAP